MTPQIVFHYKTAMKRHYGIDLYVHKKYYPKFETLEDDLRENGIPPRNYAYIVAELLKDWVKDKKLTHVPISTFCGDWVFGKVLKFWKSDETYKEENVYDGLLYDEQFVFDMFIAENLSSDKFVNLRTVVEELKPSLPEFWLKLYESGGNKKLQMEIIRKYCDMYDIPSAKSYMDILMYMRDNADL